MSISSESSPLPSGTLQHITRLGGMHRTFDPDEQRHLSSLPGSFHPTPWLGVFAQTPQQQALVPKLHPWKEQDPVGQCTTVPPVVSFLCDYVDWPAGALFQRDNSGRPMMLVGNDFEAVEDITYGDGVHHLDTADESGNRLILVCIGYEMPGDNVGYMHSLNLLSTAADPIVWATTADEYPTPLCALSEYFPRLSPLSEDNAELPTEGLLFHRTGNDLEEVFVVPAAATDIRITDMDGLQELDLSQVQNAIIEIEACCIEKVTFGKNHNRKLTVSNSAVFEVLGPISADEIFIRECTQLESLTTRSGQTLVLRDCPSLNTVTAEASDLVKVQGCHDLELLTLQGDDTRNVTIRRCDSLYRITANNVESVYLAKLRHLDELEGHDIEDLTIAGGVTTDFVIKANVRFITLENSQMPPAEFPEHTELRFGEPDEPKPTNRSASPAWMFALASLFIPGLGQALRGNPSRGALFFVATIFTCGACGLMNMGAAIDAALAD
jgi:hypothetical protein